MRMTANMVYNASEKLLNSCCVEELCNRFPGSDKRKVALYALKHLGDCGRANLFSELLTGEQLYFTEKDGRIYAYIFNSFSGDRGSNEPVTNEILKPFELTKFGKKYIRELLQIN